jgi:competence protein ComEA
MQRALIACAVAALAALAIWHPAPRPPQVVPQPASFSVRHLQASPNPAAAIVVYVAGEVTRPGLYRLHSGSRVADALGLAGGLLKSADPLAVNLAARLSDGEEVAVTARAANRAMRPTRRVAAKHSKASAVPANPVSVNDADADALARVPGIGASVARRIVEVRERDGAFASFDELLDVAGMTPARLERAQPYLIL